MPLENASLETRFLVADASTTFDDLRQLLGRASNDIRYVVLRRRDGHFSVPSLYELTQAAELLGPDVLERPLEDLPPFADAAPAVDQETVSLSAAQRERDRQPRRRLVVVRGERPVGLLTNERRGGSAHGAPLDLYGWLQGTLSREELRRRFENRVSATTCPFCEALFTFYEVRAGSQSYSCPHCHAVLTP